MSQLLTTAEAAKETGLSEYELRLGAKQGRYPVLYIGRDKSKIRRMRWNLDLLIEAINSQMQNPEE